MSRGEALKIIKVMRHRERVIAQLLLDNDIVKMENITELTGYPSSAIRSIIRTLRNERGLRIDYHNNCGRCEYEMLKEI